MRYYIYGYTDPGSGRNINEDAVLVNKEVIKDGFREAVLDPPFITAVCDGVGKEDSGEIAACLCLRELARVNYTSKTDIKQSLMAIHGKIKKKSTLDKALANMQTTLCAFAVDENGKGLCINVGDSRLYRYVNGTIRQLTADQSYGQYMFNKGEIDNADELDPAEREAVISAMGSPQTDPQIDQTPLVNEFGTEPDDMIIITTDGLSDHVSEKEFEVGLSMDLPISEKLVALAKLAVLNGSTDNVSIVGIKPFLDFEELAALTRHDAVGTTVNVIEMLGEHEEEEKDELSDILTIDLEAIIGKKVPVFQPDFSSRPEPKSAPPTEPATEPEPQPKEEPELCCEPESELEPQSEEEPELSPEPETGPEPQFEEEAELSPEPATQPEPQSEEEPELRPEPETESEPQPEEEAELSPEPETGSEPQPEEEPELRSEPETGSEEHHDMVSREDIELEAHDLFMQAQASLSRLSGLIPKKKKSE